MHTIFLGTVKKIVTLLDENQIWENYEVYDLIDEELMRNKGIAELSSIKGFSALADWKGKQFMMFLFYYGVPFLREYSTDQRYTQNLIKLSNAIYLCSRRKVDEWDLEVAKRELEVFKSTFIELYGRECMGPNFHELTEHLLSAVKRTGPLWMNSTFNFEELNFLNRKCVRSSLRPDIQISKRYF